MLTSLPGFGKPVNWAPEGRTRHDIVLFPNALDGSFNSRPTAVRGLMIIQFLNMVTDKHDWQSKVWDEDITTKWRSEIPEEIMTRKMMDWCLDELKFKSRSSAETGISCAIGHDVFESDSLITPSQRYALKKAVAPLGDIPKPLKDYHPGSDGKVLDLVHPSLYPLVYGRSRILKDAEIDLSNCLEACGKGEVVPVPSDEDITVKQSSEGHVKITSYINNLHPNGNSPIYAAIISRAIPLWNLSLTALQNHHTLPVNRIGSPLWFKFLDESGAELPEGMDFDGQPGRTFVLPDAGKFNRTCLPAFLGGPKGGKEEKIDLEGEYKDQGLQVIVKLANIQLTPDRSEYEGGSWHVEGKSNEHICATAIYYYDYENVTENHLTFRTMVNDDFGIGYAQDDVEGPETLFGLKQDEPVVQDIGSVVTKEGRLISFPNAFQHCVQPFRLEDPTQPGHRKILALFLVDPAIRIISSANIPPQQASWWADSLTTVPKLASLPAETLQQIVDAVDDFPIQLADAKEIRERLMAERRAFVQDHDEAFRSQLM